MRSMMAMAAEVCGVDVETVDEAEVMKILMKSMNSDETKKHMIDNMPEHMRGPDVELFIQEKEMTEADIEHAMLTAAAPDVHEDVD